MVDVIDPNGKTVAILLPLWCDGKHNIAQLGNGHVVVLHPDYKPHRFNFEDRSWVPMEVASKYLKKHVEDSENKVIKRFDFEAHGHYFSFYYRNPKKVIEHMVSAHENKLFDLSFDDVIQITRALQKAHG